MRKIIISAIAVLMLGMSVSASAEFYKGGDMTEVSYIEDLGGVYKDADSNPVDPFEFLAKNGMNMARIRLSNTTGKGTGDTNYYLPAGYQDEADCLELSKRAHDAGMDIQFTFNYSDYWSNGERQIIPSEWVKAIKEDLGYDVYDVSFANSMTAAQKKQIQDKLGDLVYDYTFDIMTKLKNQGTVPKYVSLGNEINGGIFFPFANTFDVSMSTTKKPYEHVYDNNLDGANDIKCYKDWAGLANILNRGYDAVKAVSPESQVVIHLANGSKDSIFEWFIGDYMKAGGKLDVIGASYYPAWSQNPIETCVSFCQNMKKKYNMDVLIMETGYNWNATKKNGYAGQLTQNAAGYDVKYPFTPEGQRDFLSDLFMQLQTGGGCVGVLYWDPAMIHVEDPDNANESLSGWAIREKDDKPDGNVVENTTLFDFDGKALPVVNAYSDFDVREFSVNSETKTAQATVKNQTMADKNVCLYVAAYDADGRLAEVKIDNKTAQANQSVNLASSVTAQGSCKAFLWDGKTFEPLTDSVN